MVSRRGKLIRCLLSSGGLCATLALGCQNILEIEPARVDPALTPQAGNSNTSMGGSDSVAGSASGSPTSGGSPGSAGMAMSIGGDDGEGSAGAPSMCDEYCTTLMDHCNGSQGEEITQFANQVQCSTVCGLMPAGVEGDRDVNSVGCRMRQARLAEYEPLSACSLAGPAGAGACGSACQAYCSLMMQVCTEETTDGLSGHYYYDEIEECLEECDEVPEQGPFSFSTTWFAGNTIECRLYHLIVATEDGIEHCEHASGYSICTE